MARRSQTVFQTIKTEGALLPADLLKRIAEGDKGLDGITPESYHLDPAEKINEATNRAWTVCQEAWQRFRKAQAELSAADKGTTLTRERWLLRLFEALGYGRLQTWKAFDIEGKSYAMSHGWGSAPIHLVSFRDELDKAGRFRTSPHSLVQEFLNRSDDHLWAFLSNGLQLRILRDNVSFTRAAYVEFDLEAMMEGEVYSDFVLLWLLGHESRVEADKPEQCWLEEWHEAAKQQGTRALDTLRHGVEKAIEAFGQGFLAHRANGELRRKLAEGELTTQVYYQQLLRLVYRFIFLFVAEDRDLLLLPDADDTARDRYANHYAMGRIRRLAERRRGTRHSDLWCGVRMVLSMLYRGETRLGLPALGSFLFSEQATPDLANCDLQNDHLLTAVRHLAFTVEDRVLRQVDYRNLGSEELGSVYESLLELHPDVNADAATFELAAVTGSERKTTGSYYTPTSLINCLLDSALDPVVADRLEGKTGKEAEQALLNLKICDPACGSGHFLIAAANRIAKRLAAIRTGDEEPSPGDQRAAFRDVVSHCIYGVDINPMAVELCKVALWLESIDPGRPLSFLDHRILCGNSLIGATPRLLAEGIPDNAFKPIEGDDKAVCKEYKRRNKDEREGQLQLDFGAMPEIKLGNLVQSFADLSAMDDDSLEGLEAKEKRYADFVGSTGYRSAHLLADAWCSAFVWEKGKGTDDCITESWFRRIEANPHSAPPWMGKEVARLRDRYHFFHWHLAFPDVFRVPGEGESPDNQRTGWSNGFDIILGNPPWDQIQLDAREFFATSAPHISTARTTAARNRAIVELATTDRDLHQSYKHAMRQVEGAQHFIHNSSRFPRTSYGRLNSAPLFAELSTDAVSAAGRAAIIVPTGIATDSFNRYFFQYVMDSGSLISLHSFENEDLIFPAVHHATRFCLLVLAGPTLRVEEADFVFFARRIDHLAEAERHFALSASDLSLLNPNSRTCPVFRCRRDAELAKQIHGRIPVLLKEGDNEDGNPWGFRGVLMFMMNTASHLFRSAPELRSDECRPVGNSFVSSEQEYLPLYEAKMISQYDHRFGTYDGQTQAQANQGKLPELGESDHADPYRHVRPRHWVASSEVEAVLEDKWSKRWLLGWRDITSAVTARTVIAAIVPRTAVANSLPLMCIDEDLTARVVVLHAALCSFVVDFAARFKVGGTHLNFFIYQQLPIIHPETYAKMCGWRQSMAVGAWVALRVLELTYAAWDLEPFAADCGYNGPPFRWNEDRRFLIRCELDAAYFHLYGIERDDVDYIMETFPIVKRKDEKAHSEYRTKRVILEIYDEMAEAMKTGQPYQTRLDPPPGPPADEQGNFLPLPDWQPGQTRPADWPRHIHGPREVYDWAKEQGIDWRTLLEPVEGHLPSTTEQPSQRR